MMKDYCRFIVICIIGSCIQPALSSYLGYPRIHFSGSYRSDCNTRNNVGCNYRLNQPPNPDLNDVDWNTNGTNEFQFVNAKVTSVVDEDGKMSTSDTIVGSEIFGNLKRPIGKLADLDIGSGEHSILFGHSLGIRSGEDSDYAFHGKWTPGVISQYVWTNLKCYNQTHHGKQLYQSDLPQGGQGVTTITDIDWNNYNDSDVLRRLRDIVGTGSLTVRITMVYFTTNYPPYVARNATLGYVYGVIGTPSPSDTLSVPGERTLFPTDSYPVDLTFDEHDLCYNQSLEDFGSWMNSAPFEVDMKRNEVRLDLSNSIPTQIGNSLRSFGELRLGISLRSCVYLLGDQPILYSSTGDLPFTSGIYTIELDSFITDMASLLPLVLVQVVKDKSGHVPVCGDSILSTEDAHTVQILLQEEEYFIRPTGNYSYQLDRETKPSVNHTVYVTRFGVPVPDVGIKMVPYDNLGTLGPAIPADGIIPVAKTVNTDENGYATFQFEMNPDVRIPLERHYHGMPCINSPYPDNKTTLPIDGQNYLFYFCMDSSGIECKDITIRALFHAFSDVSFSEPYTWKKDVGPILARYARLSPIMHKILDMSSYHEVTEPQNIQMLNLTLRLDYNDPSYMPTTRDLSPAKRNMILKWLEQTPPKFDVTPSNPLEETPVCQTVSRSGVISRSDEHYRPPRCSSRIDFTNEPMKHHEYFSSIISTINPDPSLYALPSGSRIVGRPLLGHRHMSSDSGEVVCSKDSLMKQLQTAIQLEWATIPTYLTSLYSITEGCNTEIYDLIRSVTIQEMLHMTLASNILIAINGVPVIDDPNFTPTFPTKLPGGVLPGLVVHLDKMSLRHVRDVFMAIEVPQHTKVAGEINITNVTIGAFYKEISECIRTLGDDIFNQSTLDKQVKWPWKPSDSVGKVVPIFDALSALLAIKEIMSQGEGANTLDPDSLTGDSLAHFFKFEEIVCQRKLIKINVTHYGYEGKRIPYDSHGVWPMRRDPRSHNVRCHTNCYTESRAFHKVYRMFLRKLQEIFDGKPEDIFMAIELMESLQVHAKKLMYTQFYPDDPYEDITCGPVWDYDWKGEIC